MVDVESSETSATAPAPTAVELLAALPEGGAEADAADPDRRSSIRIADAGVDDDELRLVHA